MSLQPVDKVLDENGGVQNVPVMCVPQLRGGSEVSTGKLTILFLFSGVGTLSVQTPWLF
jgi:hypothetical protein